MYKKDFDSWNKTKKRVNTELHQRQFIRPGEIRWAALGVNVGSEMDGTGESFTRPVVVIHITGTHLAMVTPLSTKVKTLPGYDLFLWKGRKLSICIHQTRVISQKRLLRRFGRIRDSKLREIRKRIGDYFSLC